MITFNESINGVLMNRNTRLIATFGFAILLILTALISVSTVPSHADEAGAANDQLMQSAPRLQATEGSDLPPDTPSVELDKPTKIDLAPDNPSRLFTFQGKANQIVSVTFTPQSEDLFISATILDSDLQNILGELQGTSVLGGSVAVKLPADGQYVISIGYSELTDETPKAGSVEMLLSEFKAK
jgi:hypothetical protein